MGSGFHSTSKKWLKTMQKRSQETVLSASQPYSTEQGEGLVSAGSGRPRRPCQRDRSCFLEEVGAREERDAVIPVSLPQHPGDGWEALWGGQYTE